VETRRCLLAPIFWEGFQVVVSLFPLINQKVQQGQQKPKMSFAFRCVASQGARMAMRTSAASVKNFAGFNPITAVKRTGCQPLASFATQQSAFTFKGAAASPFGGATNSNAFGSFARQNVSQHMKACQYEAARIQSVCSTSLARFVLRALSFQCICQVEVY
jgi:hypothetical protein